MANYNSRNNGYQQRPQQGGYNQQQSYQQPQPQQQPQQNSGNQQQGEFNRPFSAKIINRPFHRDPQNPNAQPIPGTLEECTMAVLLRPGDRGDNVAINYMNSNGKERIRLNFNLKIGQKEVGEVFGPELVREDNTVDFTVFMSGYDVQNMLQYPPKATQSILILVTNMKINEYTDRNGVKRLSVVGNARGFQKIGSTKKRDGSDAKPMMIFGAENANQQPQQGGYQAPQGGFQPPQGGYQQPQQGGYQQPGPAPDAGPNWEEFSDDDDLPF